VVIPEQGFVRGTVQRNHVAEHAPVFSLQVGQLPIHTLRCHEFFNVIEMLLQERDLLFDPIAAKIIERSLQRVEGSTTVFNKFSALYIVKKFIVFGVK
jgi:hypothetical protein